MHRKVYKETRGKSGVSLQLCPPCRARADAVRYKMYSCSFVCYLHTNELNPQKHRASVRLSNYRITSTHVCYSSQYIHANTSRYYYSRSATVIHFYSMLLLYYWYWYSVRTGVRIYYRVPYESIPD